MIVRTKKPLIFSGFFIINLKPPPMEVVIVHVGLCP